VPIIRHMKPSDLLAKFRKDREWYAAYLRELEEGRHHMKVSLPDGSVQNDIPRYVDHLRGLIADLDAIIADGEADDA
jgi:hypothetical protein